ncbi:MAG: glycosyltransferase family 4 protein [Alphaproteobacteria bacterium]|nr:glycosyltransferase family 4 protein [Alphaproteobacteria bacterium]
MILITTQCFPPDRGGIENLMGGLAQTLHASGHEVRVFADRAHDDAPFAPSFEVVRFGGFKPLRRRLKAWAVAKACKGAKIDGVFADSWKSIELLGDVGAPLAVLAHGMEFPAKPSAAKQARIARAFAKVRTVIASSAYTAALAKPYVSGATRLVVTNPPLAPQPAPSEAALAGIREIVAGRSPVLLSLCRLEPRKGVDMVIRALPRVLETHPKALYIVAGGGDDRARLETLARETGVADSVHFAGMVDGEAKAALFASADAFVMPTRRDGDSVEGFGIVYMEAAWYGLAALAGREGGAVDAVADGETGVVCDAGDVAAVAAGVLKLIEDRAQGGRLAKAAAARARGPAQWTAALPQYLKTLT